MSAQTVLEEGQLWSIDGMANATALIGRIDVEEDGVIAHLFVTIDTPVHLIARFGPRLELGHMPLYSATVAEAVDTLVAAQQMPPAVFAEGYAAWRGDEEAGVFDMPLPEAIDAIVTIALGGVN